MNKPILLIATLTLGLATALAQTTTLYRETFAGSGGPLNGKTPDVSTTGASWQAGNLFYDNGFSDSVVAGSANGQGAWLPFTPVAGGIYTAEATLLNSNANWVAFGFFSQYPVNNSGIGWTETRWETRHSNSGYLWALLRNHATSPDIQGFLGYGTGNQVLNLTDPAGVDFTRPIKLTFVLDATAATWTGAIYLNDVSQWTGPIPSGTQTGIAGVGFSHERNSTANTGAWISGFTLTMVPEPGAGALLLLGLAGWLARHRRG